MIIIKKKIILGSVAGVFVITAIILVVIVFRDSAPQKTDVPGFQAYLSESAGIEKPDTQAAYDNAASGNGKNNSAAEASSKEQNISAPKSSADTTKKSAASVSSPAKAGETTSRAAQTDEPTKYKRTGTMQFSDSPDNAFIKAIVKKYGSDSSLLVAIYTVPQADGNTVLEFDGTKDSSGKLIRNGDTLKYIYTLDASYNSKRASQKSSENDGYSSFDSSMMFYSVKKYLLPEYEKELSS